VLAGWRLGLGAHSADEAAHLMADAVVADDARGWRSRQAATRGGSEAAGLLARFNGVSATETKKDMDLCKGAFKGMLELELPPIDLGSPGAEMAIVGAARYPRWQPISKPAVPQPGVWANVEEVRASVPERAVLAEGWESVERFLSSWPADLRAVPRGRGAAGFAARMVPDRLGPSPLAVRPGAVIRCDLPTAGGAGVELADLEIVDVQPSSFRLASLAVVGPQDGAVYREARRAPHYPPEPYPPPPLATPALTPPLPFPLHPSGAGHPFCGVWELGFFRGLRDEHDPKATDDAPKDAGKGAVTFYVRTVAAPDGPAVQAAGLHVAREAWAGFMQGIAERFGAPAASAGAALRGIGGSRDEFYSFVKEEPACYKAPSGPASAELYDPTEP